MWDNGGRSRVSFIFGRGVGGMGGFGGLGVGGGDGVETGAWLMSPP